MRDAGIPVPQLPQVGGKVKTGKIIFRDWIDEKNSTHEFHVESAGLPIPEAVDQIYTLQAIA